jgi:hypothetical protein
LGLLKADNGGVDAAGENHVTDKLSMTSPLIPLASNDLFGGFPQVFDQSARHF